MSVHSFPCLFLEAGTKRKTEKSSSSNNSENNVSKKPKITRMTKPSANIDVLKEAPNEHDLLDLLADVDSMWQEVGLALVVDGNFLEGLQKEKDSNTTKLSKVIRCWINTKSSPVTWETVIAAMEGRVVNNKAKADEIREHLGLSTNK